MSATLQHNLGNLTGILQQVGERVEGNLYCDIEPTRITADMIKINNLRAAVEGKKKICEIGVNACHSFLFMLDANSTAEYVLFDIGIHTYLDPCFSYVESVFPTTSMKLYVGDSKLTVPSYAEHHEGEFDCCHIDGGHMAPEFTSDYNSCMKLLKQGGLLVFDDYDYPEIKSFVDSKLQSGEVTQVVGSLFNATSRQIILAKV
jgi:predicted O-methyltransferase YrrM